ncbi:hypothetical protein N7456_000819 [Penicillium angulare]|uniref:F-box domain-containing protein n=1 Tax=Penicillium angulare TaxID=116970 RepID=A0A9W9GCV2_9EURO|nr:hypothetical protein N7456_000819 [Penicillium angulare]
MKRKARTQLLNLTDLPPELVLDICDFLSPAQIVCLALCNHGLMGLLFPKGPKALNDRLPKGPFGDMTNERSLLLTMLSIDLPQYYVCCICSQLHLWSTVDLPGYYSHLKCFPQKNSSQLEAKQCWLLCQPFKAEFYAPCSFYEFHFVHLQLMMRRFRHGPSYGLSPDTALYAEVNLYPLPSLKGSHIESFSLPGPADELFDKSHVTHIFSAEARVYQKAPSLVLRLQSIGMVSREFAPMLIPKKQISISLCNHFRFNSNPETSDTLKAPIEAYWANGTLGVYQGKCRKCNTEYEIQVREANTDDVTLTITRWADLGPGLTPKDMRWRSHLLLGRGTVDTSDIVSNPRQRFDHAPGSHKSGSYVSIEERYRRNMSYLQAQGYRDKMEQVGNLAWVASYDFDFGNHQTDRVTVLSSYKYICKYLGKLYNQACERPLALCKRAFQVKKERD